MEVRTFSDTDQALFAELSGDHNALHVNALEARRTLFGRQIVHGIHLLLWSLETLLPRPCRLAELSVSFDRPVGVGEPVSCRAIGSDANGLDIELESRGATVCVAHIVFGDPIEPAPFLSGTPPGASPRLMDSSEIDGAGGEVELFFDRDRYRRLCARGDSRLPADQVAALLASTRLVGMECPGADSIYSELRLTWNSIGNVSRSRMGWRVSKFDPRFRRVAMRVDGPGWTGTVLALVRPRPQSQLSFKEARLRVPAGLFSGQTALVVGGSRGVGEACAKLLAAGGATIYVTYHRGVAEAEALVQDIRLGGAAVTGFAFDVLHPSDLAVVANQFPSHVYYFATPPIFVASKGRFSHEILSAFSEIYVRGLLNTYTALRAISSADIDIYYPSSVAVTSVPANMGEYAAAKAAGETVCRYLAATDNKLTVRIDRLPRLATDQTASVLNAESADTIETLLQALTNNSPMRLNPKTGQMMPAAARSPA